MFKNTNLAVFEVFEVFYPKIKKKSDKRVRNMIESEKNEGNCKEGKFETRGEF